MDKVIIIAEAGVNHNGDINIAKKLIDIASDAGADYVKFQTFKTELCMTPNAEMADYQKKNATSETSQFDMIKKLELDESTHLEIKDYCLKKKIKFLSTAFDLPSIHFLNSLNIDFFKIPSGEVTNYPYLREIGKLNKKIVLSTGMCNLEEISAAIDVLTKYGCDKEKISILHCNTEYPTPMEDVNLNALKTIKDEFKLEIGYSDHTLGIEVPIAAVALGAKIIEKHFTLDRNMDGPDHKASLEPHELKNMVASIRNIEKSLGKFEKVATNSEKKNLEIARKSIIAKTDISKGDIFTEENLAVMRPGTGISPMNWNNIIGVESKNNYKKNDLIKVEQ